ncbi:G-box-binding factor 4-like isoform X2 [Mercurialis annua]|uniref:G-box-binding factor 4-like isoform X2 n=1 Tax=Mercurialis annua TaxID=3986 RepID=UPI0021603F7D|nr:G-box-binding factor 4-like isoform X2 [Mercurialis annua]
MASSKVMASSKPKSSDLASSTTRSSRRPNHIKNTTTPTATTTNNTFNSSLATMTPDGILLNSHASSLFPNSNSATDSTLLDAQITLMDNPTPPPQPIDTVVASNQTNFNQHNSSSNNKTVDEVWREIVSGRKEMKEEQSDEMMTLEDFLAKAGAVDVVGEEDVDEDDDVKMPLPLTSSSGGMYAFDHHQIPVSTSSNAFQILDKIEGSIVTFGNGGGSGGSGLGRGKRGRSLMMEPLDKAAQQRQRRMIKNRESAARSRERKQAYQVELESLAVKLEEENEQLLKEKEERNKERFKQLMEKVVPVVEKRRPPRMLRRVHSMQW